MFLPSSEFRLRRHERIDYRIVEYTKKISRKYFDGGLRTTFNASNTSHTRFCVRADLLCFG